MREEMLKRLDELIAGLSSRERLTPWAEFRAELAAERCDACRWWRGTSMPGHLVQRCAYIDTLMYPDACCSHFEKKEPA
jgi:hypothetical protein